jgi:predicted TIM-barrel fold metal-dependent hydrolase
MSTTTSAPGCQPPRATARPPRMRVPALACDCHAHVLGPPSRFPYALDRSYTPPDALPESYLRMLTTLGLERMVVVQASCYGEDNRRTVAAVQELGIERARGVAMVGAGVREDELKALDDAGIRATRFITTARGGPSLEQLPEVAAKVAAFGWHVEMYVPTVVWPDILPVVERLPVPVVFDHIGGMMADTSLDDPIMRRILALLESGRCWTKLTGYRPSVAGHPYADVAPLARHFIDRAPDRCVWGTDWPHTNIEGTMPDDGDLLDQLGEWTTDAGMRRKILVENPAKLYRFDDQSAAS